MARRANSSIKISKIILICFSMIAFMLIAFYLYKKNSNPFRGMAILKSKDYISNSRSLSGNRFYLECKIQEKIKWQANVGTLWSVKVIENNDSNPFISLFFPTKFDKENIQIGQNIKSKLELTKMGFYMQK